jgi:peptidoglycan/LPS O-acetylase OafA/YrhL
MLDGWRALSISLVLAGHLLPIGPKSWDLNVAVAAAGMAIFFTLSGFLITSFLLARPEPGEFLRRRLFRIVPLAWTAMLILAFWNTASAFVLFANLGFFANLPPGRLMNGGVHLWSLCVEMQFYLLVAALVAVGGRRSLYLLPLLCLAVTTLRIAHSNYIDSITWYRVDEILAGATLALIYDSGRLKRIEALIPRSLPLFLFGLLLISGHQATGPFNYVRPYLAALAVGTSLYAAPALVQRLFGSAPARYVAEISYALYVFHGMLMATWLGSGERLEKYLKRPLFIFCTFALAHASTAWFERPLIRIGKSSGGPPKPRMAN